jgi:hypothetical protein
VGGYAVACVLGEFEKYSSQAKAIDLAHFAQWAHILWIKDQNYWKLQQEEIQIKKEMAGCHSPCRLVLPPPGRGVSKDWVLPSFVWDSYYNRIRLLYFPGKTIQVKMQDEEK